MYPLSTWVTLPISPTLNQLGESSGELQRARVVPLWSPLRIVSMGRVDRRKG